MEETIRIVDRTRKPPTPGAGSAACLVHIYPTGPAMGSRYPLGDATLMLGRDSECDIQIAEDSVSRRHACIDPVEGGYRVRDLQSTNGTFLNQQRITCQALQDGDYLNIGSTIFRYLAGGNVEAEYHEEIYRLTIMDGLTGIHNKRYLLEVLARDLACASRYRRPLALLLFDLDRFKEVNDQLGHLCGDFTLRELAACLKGVLRKADLFARYGGDEFAVVMPETGQEEAVELAERLRLRVEQYPFQYEGQSFPMSISVGVAAITGDGCLTSTEIIRQADEKLFQAKKQGRNQVVS